VSREEGDAFVDRDSATSILLVDDDETFRSRLAQAFARRGYEVRQAGTGVEAVAEAARESPEQAVIDLRMPGPLDGLGTLRGILDADPTTRCVVLTGYGSIATAVEALRLGAIHYLTKPADVDDLVDAFTSAPGEGRSAKARDPSRPGSVPTLARVEWEHIQRVLAEVDGNVSQAARLLGIHRRSLQRKLAKNPTPR